MSPTAYHFKQEKNPLNREMLIPARWPDMRPPLNPVLSASAEGSDEPPDWGMIFDTEKTWGRIEQGDHNVMQDREKMCAVQPNKALADGTLPKKDNGKSGNKRRCVKYGEGFLKDAAGKAATFQVEVEEGEFETVKTEGRPALPEDIDATGAVITMAWGKGMTELGYVWKRQKDRLWFNRIWCPREQGNDLPPYQQNAP